MNWTDILVIAIIVVFAVIGMKTGFVLSVFRLISYFASIFVSLKIYPIIAQLLAKTVIATRIKDTTFKNLLLQSGTLTDGVNNQVKETAAQTVIDHLKLPGFLKNSIKASVPNVSEVLPVEKVMEAISEQLTWIVIQIISLILVYIIVRVVLVFVKVVLRSITKLPLFKQLDKFGGFALGAVEGLMSIYVLFAILMLFSSSPKLANLFSSIESSVVAKFFYQNNFIINFMFPK